MESLSHANTTQVPRSCNADPLAIPALSVVVPLYNEKENIPALHQRLTAVLGALGVPYEIVFVNDGSRDETPYLIEQLQARDTRLTVVHLSRNFGHQAAMSAGLDQATGRAVVLMDGDLQDPPETIPQLVARWRDGWDVVYAVRKNRKEGRFKRLGYFVFYRLLHSMSDLKIPLDSGDFCLMDRRVVDTLKGLPERVRFVRGLRTFVGFRQTAYEYDRDPRLGGQPKYSFSALVALAVDGLVSFSGYPLRLVTYFGLAIGLAALLLIGWVLYAMVMGHNGPRGWASLAAIILGIGSAQLICLGVMGEYIRLIFLESKGRPTYVIGQYRPARALITGLAEAGQAGSALPEKATTS